ncbi:MAG: ATP-binding cassette domain-containing protein, partial [Rhodobacteraceae bacterium]|nr:ATP-binding cassette domain-containing protein [Paracoccaceae bacterium]
QKDGQGRWSLENMFEMFSNLRERADVEASVLSGGEQQMLTMCRTLMGDPELIMIDEPTEGLSPKMVQRVASLLKEIAKRGIATLLVEQKLAIALKERLPQHPPFHANWKTSQTYFPKTNAPARLFDQA